MAADEYPTEDALFFQSSDFHADSCKKNMNLVNGDRDDQPNFRIWHQHLYFSEENHQKDSVGKSPGIDCDIEIDIGFFLRLTKRQSKLQGL